MYATLTMGAQGQSHKNVDPKRNYFMYLYYNNKVSLNYDYRHSSHSRISRTSGDAIATTMMKLQPSLKSILSPMRQPSM